MKNYTILSQATSRWLGRPANSTTTKQTLEPIPPRKLEPIPPPLKIQVFELLRQNGFAFTEAQELAADVINRFNASPRQRVFAFGPVSFEITAGLRTRLISAPVSYETLARVLERIEAQQNIEIERLAREIRERRERDERRRPW